MARRIALKLVPPFRPSAHVQHHVIIVHLTRLSRPIILGQIVRLATTLVSTLASPPRTPVRITPQKHPTAQERARPFAALPSGSAVHVAEIIVRNSVIDVLVLELRDGSGKGFGLAELHADTTLRGIRVRHPEPGLRLDPVERASPTFGHGVAVDALVAVVVEGDTAVVGRGGGRKQRRSEKAGEQHIDGWVSLVI